MALMRVQIDKRTIAGLASGGTATYAHGLGAAPDAVLIRFIATLAAAGATQWIGIAVPVNATNITLQNCGSIASGDMEVCAIRFHTIIQ